MEMQGWGKGLIIVGILITLVGVLLAFSPKFPFFGKLPGDFLVKQGNVTFYLPLASSLLLSLVLSLVMYLIRKFF